MEVTPELVAGYRNQGGLDLLGRSMETFDTKEHMDAIKDTCAALKLQGLVFIGGARTATGGEGGRQANPLDPACLPACRLNNRTSCLPACLCLLAVGVAYLHEYLRASQVPTVVTVVPCSIDGTMANQFVETSVGYHTACQVYGELVGNTAIDGASAKKYWMFRESPPTPPPPPPSPPPHVEGVCVLSPVSVRLMGADPSNIALEVALQSAPNMVLLAEGG